MIGVHTTKWYMPLWLAGTGLAIDGVNGMPKRYIWLSIDSTYLCYLVGDGGMHPIHLEREFWSTESLAYAMRAYADEEEFLREYGIPYATAGRLLAFALREQERDELSLQEAEFLRREADDVVAMREAKIG